MRLDPKITEAIETLDGIRIQRYLQCRKWTKAKSKVEHLAIFRTETPRPVEILLPLDRVFGDYSESILAALQKIALAEDRDIGQVIDDLLMPPADIIRFRVASDKTSWGGLPIKESFALLENAKKSLMAAACDVLSPSPFHKKLSVKEAQNFVDSCYLGQTERGSFIAPIVCPFISENEELSPFSDSEQMAQSFTRKTTRKYIQSISKLKSSIEDGKQDLSDLQGNEQISANFIESIAELGEWSDKERIEISVAWSALAQEEPSVPTAVALSKEHIAPMTYMASKMRPAKASTPGIFVGRVSKTESDPDIESRTDGTVTFAFLDEDEQVKKAEVRLGKEDFDKAIDAFKNGHHIKVTGTLVASSKKKTIENPALEILERF
jgi:hypothetical protein